MVAEKPDIFEVNFQRHVDYCSGLFLLTPKHLFHNLGGFDERYSPAYCEDCDYCVRVNLAGLKVLYEPRIVVGHIEGGSAIKNMPALSIKIFFCLIKNMHTGYKHSCIYPTFQTLRPVVC